MTTATLSIQSDDDDVQVRADGSSFDSGGTYVSVRADNALSSRGNMGFRFTEGVPWSDAATINSAKLTLDVTSTSLDDALCDIYLVDEADPAAWGASRKPYDNVTDGVDLSSASVEWAANSLGAGDVDSPDITALIERHQALGGGTGRDIAFVFQGRDNGALLDLNCRNQGNGGQVCRLVVDYTEPVITIPPTVLSEIMRPKG